MERLKTLLTKTWPYLSALLSFGLLFLLGCAMTDTLFGYNPAAPDGGASSPAPSDFLGNLLSGWLPWAAGALGGLRAFYIEARKRRMDEMFRAVVIEQLAIGVKVAGAHN